MSGSSLTISWLTPDQFDAFRMTEIDGIRVDYPAKWGSGEGAIIYLEDANGGMHKLNLTDDLVAKLMDGLRSL
jgi:hypothetical protein